MSVSYTHLLEQYRDLATWIEQDDHGDYLVDCATMLTTNRLFDLVNEWYPEKGYLSDEQFLSKAEQARILEAMEAEWSQILSAMKERQATFWIVTNEVGLGIVPDTRLGRYFRDLQGLSLIHICTFYNVPFSLSAWSIAPFPRPTLI